MVTKKYEFHAEDAVRQSALLRLALCGPSGGGKTKTALIIATRMVERMGLGPVFVIDSEDGSASFYAYSPRTKQGHRFKHLRLPEDDTSPAAYMAAIDYCEAQGAGVIIIDSLSHAWIGAEGVLEQVDQVTERSRSKNAFSEGWRALSAVQTRLIRKITSSSAHVIVTMRAKTEWVIQENERGKKEPVKVGLAPVQRAGAEYEYSAWGDMSVPDNVLTITKSRIDRLAIGEMVRRPGPEFADILVEWMEDADAPSDARTLGEALNQAVAEGVLAAEERSADKYKEAKRRLIGWCETHGVSPARRDDALARFKERVGAVAGPRAPSTASAAPGTVGFQSDAPTLSDEERLRAIDQARA